MTESADGYHTMAEPRPHRATSPRVGSLTDELSRIADLLSRKVAAATQVHS